jgi:hypothetical protein
MNDENDGRVDGRDLPEPTELGSDDRLLRGLLAAVVGRADADDDAGDNAD